MVTGKGPLFSKVVTHLEHVLNIIRIVAALCFLEHGLRMFFGFPAALRNDPASLRPGNFGAS